MAKLWFGYIGGVVLGMLLMIRAVQAQDVTIIESFELEDQTGKPFALTAVASQKAVVVLFTSSNCVFATPYEARIQKLHEQYKDQGVSFVAINANDPALSQRDDEVYLRQALPFTFPYLKDRDQSVAHAFGAKANPEVFILVPTDSQFEVRYRGMIDDNPLNESMAKTKYLAENLEALVAGKALPHAHNEVKGCEITWQ